jgi:hypothetical protein
MGTILMFLCVCGLFVGLRKLINAVKSDPAQAVQWAWKARKLMGR